MRNRWMFINRVMIDSGGINLNSNFNESCNERQLYVNVNATGMLDGG